jgi:ribosomal protein S18 acetylase RimI-like enzyme
MTKIAAAVLIVDAKDETAKRFYIRHGFQSVSGVDRRLFISLAVVEQLLSSQDAQ